jgi:Protein metal binding site./Protein of unknown function (DUF1566).
MRFNILILITILSSVLFSCGSGNKSDNPNDQNADISDSDSQEEDNDCINGTYRCKGNMVQKCDEEKWQNVQKCTDDRVCNEETGKCDLKSNEIDDNDDSDKDNLPDENNDKDSECTEEGDFKCHSPFVSYICQDGYWKHYEECPEDETCNNETGQCEKENPCNMEPCSNITNSTGVCTRTGETTYICGCEANYEWIVENSSCESIICTPNETRPCYEGPIGTDGVGICKAGIATCLDDGTGWGKCIGQVTPKAEICSNGIDENCDGADMSPENAFDYDGDGYNYCTGDCCETGWESGCLGTNSPESINPIADEITNNGFDDNCNGQIDEVAQPVKTLSMICTEQTKCYDPSKEIDCPTSSNENYYGQDTQYAQLGYCISHSFTIKTILNQKIIVDNNLGIEWQGIVNADEYNWEDAVSYCENLTYAGSSDWRLPTSQEFIAIDDCGKYPYPYNTTYFSHIQSAANYLWTLDYANEGEAAFAFNSYEGSVHKNADSNLFNAICVRGNKVSIPIFDTLTINEEDVLVNSISNIMWQGSSKKGLAWAGALSYCENLTYAGFSDWRLPNINELSSLFPNMFSTGENFWSSTTMPGNYTWLIWSNYCTTPHAAHTNSESVRCVRNYQ